MGEHFNTKHGFDGTPTYRSWGRSWGAMKTRCLNPKAEAYKNHGARGITVCERWLTFENFLADMGVRPEGTELERIDNNGNYEPGNCRWATRKEQANNRRSNVLLTVNGKTQTAQAWADEFGLSLQALRHRMKVGWSLEEIQSTPVGDGYIAGESHPGSKLTETKVKDIRSRHAAGQTLQEIADAHGVSPQTVWRVAHGKAWAHVA